TGGDVAYAVVVDDSNHIHLMGNFENTVDFNPDPTAQNALTSHGSSDIFMAKYDADGAYIRAGNIGGMMADLCYSLAVDTSGNAYITGAIIYSADFDPDPAVTQTLPNSSFMNRAFLAKYNANGALVWASTLDGAAATGFALTTDEAQNVYLSGQFTGTVDFNPDATQTANLQAGTSGFGYSPFLAKYNPDGDYIWAQKVA